MPNFEPTEPAQITLILERLGFIRVHQSGSHAVYHHTDGRWTTVPIHKDRALGKGILGKILKDANITVDEFEKLH